MRTLLLVSGHGAVTVTVVLDDLDHVADRVREADVVMRPVIVLLLVVVVVVRAAPRARSSRERRRTPSETAGGESAPSIARESIRVDRAARTSDWATSCGRSRTAAAVEDGRPPATP